MSYLDIENDPGRYKASDGKAFLWITRKGERAYMTSAVSSLFYLFADRSLRKSNLSRVEIRHQVALLSLIVMDF